MGLVAFRKTIKDIKSSVPSNKEDIRNTKENSKSVKSEVTVNEISVQQGFEQAGRELADLKERVEEIHGPDSGFTSRITRIKNEFTLLRKEVNQINDTVEEKHGIDLF